jgi:hypothetical protein
MSKLAIQEKSRKNIDFHPFWGKQNCGQFETMIRNATLSFDLTPIFKMLKTWGIKTPH